MRAGFVVRVGDQDGYHVEPDPKGVIRRLQDSGCSGPFAARLHGLECPGYRGNNYISSFWGYHDERKGSTPVRGLTPEEVADINLFF